MRAAPSTRLTRIALAAALAAALAGCALKAAATRGRPAEGSAAAYRRADGLQGHRWRGCAPDWALAGQLQRPGLVGAGRRGAELQRRPPGRGAAGRARRRLPEGGRRGAAASGGRLRYRQRCHVQQHQRPEWPVGERLAGARHLGPHPLRAGGGSGRCRGPGRGLCLCTPVAGGDGRQELVRGHRSRACSAPSCRTWCDLRSHC